MAILTAAEYRSWAGIGDNADDSAITTQIGYVQKWAERWCGRVFDQATITEKISGLGSEAIVLSSTPVASITSVTVTDGAGNAVRALAATDYKIDLATGELRLTPVSYSRRTASNFDLEDDVSSDQFGPSQAFPDDFLSVTVVYLGGYSTIADDVKMAAARSVDAVLNNRRVQASSKGDFDPAGLENTLRTIWTPYRKGETWL